MILINKIIMKHLNQKIKNIFLNIKTWLLNSKLYKIPMEVYYTDKNDENEGRVIIWVKHENEVEMYFNKHFPHLKLYDVGYPEP